MARLTTASFPFRPKDLVAAVSHFVGLCPTILSARTRVILTTKAEPNDDSDSHCLAPTRGRITALRERVPPTRGVLPAASATDRRISARG